MSMSQEMRETLDSLYEQNKKIGRLQVSMNVLKLINSCKENGIDSEGIIERIQTFLKVVNLMDD